jgi:uncharacterized cupredoxin-like copper-binding protein
MKRLHKPAPTTVAGTLSVLTAAALASGAAGSGRSDAARADGPVVNAAPVHLLLKLNEFNITPYVNAVRAGRVKITVFNRGKRTHEMLIVEGRTALPMMKSGRVDEVALERKHRVVGELADVRRRSSASKVFVLKKGSYMLFCNLPHHYGSGMRASLIVRGR